jgi:hypothetical protein
VAEWRKVRELDSLAGAPRAHVGGHSSARARAGGQRVTLPFADQQSAPLVIFEFDADGVFTLSEGKGLLPRRLASRARPSASRSSRSIVTTPRFAKKRAARIAGETLHFTLHIHMTRFSRPISIRVRADDDALQVIGVADGHQRTRARGGAVAAGEAWSLENSPVMLFRWRAEAGWPAVFVFRQRQPAGLSGRADLRDGSIQL